MRTTHRIRLLLAGLALLSVPVTAVVAVSPAGAQSPPAAPRNLRVVDVGDTTVSLDWDPSPTPGVQEYQVLANGEVVTWPTTTDIVVVDLDPETTYTFMVRAIFRTSSEIITGPVSNAVTATTEPDVTPPNAPTLRLNGRTQTTVTLGWNGNGDNDRIEDYLLSNGAEELTFEDQWTHRFENLTPGTTYSFTVRARDRSDNVSPPSNVVTVTMDATPPSAPSGLTFNPATRVLSWQPSTDNLDPPAFLTYRVYAAGRPVDLFFPPGSSTSVDLGLEVDCGNTVPNGTYTVTATDQTGNESGPSNAVEVRL